MKFTIIRILLPVAALACSLVSYAASALKTDPAVSSGRLGCGLSYYIVSNTSKAGTADFALVRKTGRDTSAGAAEETLFARKCLDSLPHFPAGRRSPMDFLSDNGVSYPRTGYVSAGKDAVLYHFRDVDLSRSGKMTDSTLLLLFDIALKTASSGPGRDNGAGSPDNQAIIIAGDVDKDAIMTKMDLLSLMVNRTGKPEEQAADSTCSGDSFTPGIPEFFTGSDSTSGISHVNMVFYGPVMPRNMLGSAASLVSAKFWDEFRSAAGIRISMMMREKGIPYSSIRFTRACTSDSGDRERYTVSAGCKAGDTTGVKDIMHSVLSDMKENGIRPGEYAYAKAVSSRNLYTRASTISRENSDYVKKCVSAFLYGAGIVSAKDEADFFLTSGLPDSTGLRLLNSYISSLLPEMPGSPEIENIIPEFSQGDTLLLADGHQRAKVRKTRNSKVSGGQIWYFSNGMVAIYKKMPTNGNIHYSWVLRGGAASVPDLKAGEGAFYSGLLFRGDICGMDGDTFRRMLAAEGISMDARVGISDTRIYGSAPFYRLPLLMKALLSVAEGYSADREAGEYYMECERLNLSSVRGEYQSRLAIIDSIMCPGYRYYLNKSASGLYPDLPERAEKFFKAQFSKANDGALVLIGDMDEIDVRKTLEQYLGSLPVRKNITVRPSILYQPVSGWSTYVSDGRANSIDVMFSSRIMLNSTDYMSAQVVTLALKDAIAGALADTGMSVKVTDSFSTFPHERYSVSVSAMPAPLSTLPPTVTKGSYFRCLYQIRSAVSGLVRDGIDGSAVEMYKSMLSDRYASVQSSPEVWARMISDRVSTGKSLDADYAGKISGVTAESVNKVLSELNEGCTIEYVIKND
ncbi:MAG: hypothetical protein IAC29_07575 [Bacteroidetes bacterium]|uniref:Peptidase M16 C-terminal domain-containing protein n=1 Tax=Candidatus Cryptobacteroides merdigallinarum TaxID=2840770 RepID=A0A9D9EJQ7_9BACT|nr:hypothetical protein [Candidatus Cryptobacteroides merdigallinarum]